MQTARVGFALCGSFCTFDKVLAQLETLTKTYETVYPIVSETSYITDSRFGKASDYIQKIETLCGHPVWHTIAQVEPIGPKALLDVLVVAPCTGNTLAKLANGIADSAVTMACKAHLRNERPVVLAVSTNDGLCGNAANLGKLLARKHMYFVPFGQDSAVQKPCSLVADMDRLIPALEAALEGKQLQPILYA